MSAALNGRDRSVLNRRHGGDPMMQAALHRADAHRLSLFDFVGRLCRPEIAVCLGWIPHFHVMRAGKRRGARHQKKQTAPDRRHLFFFRQVEHCGERISTLMRQQDP
ncbi:hypothetical protein [Paraburkholderia hospita]|uniref:hypothetical protein n=1 Tax=Paraburkholderia hospita TaxID=169430 RepID=UPI0013F16DF4|nr:hypothetical protein [Paraburkholderia hospita]